jgi:hypothetical protein
MTMDTRGRSDGGQVLQASCIGSARGLAQRSRRIRVAFARAAGD